MTAWIRPRRKHPGLRFQVHGLGAALGIGLAALLAGCASNSIGDTLPTSMGGLPPNAPARPAVAPEFLPVHDMPHERDVRPLSDEERKKVEADLVAVRTRQESNANGAQAPANR